VRLAKGYVVKPCHASLVEAVWALLFFLTEVWALQTLALGIKARWVKLYKFYRILLTRYNNWAHRHEQPGPFMISGYLDGLGMMLTLTNITFNLGWFIH
jgi:hypothetical protein